MEIITLIVAERLKINKFYVQKANKFSALLIKRFAITQIWRISNFSKFLHPNNYKEIATYIVNFKLI